MDVTEPTTDVPSEVVPAVVETPPVVVPEEKRTLDITLRQCQIAEKAQYVATLLAQLNGHSNRVIVQDFLQQPGRYQTARTHVKDVQKYMRILMKTFDHIYQNVNVSLETSGIGDLEGQDLLDAQTDSEGEGQMEDATTKKKKRKSRGRTRVARKTAKARKMAEAMEDVVCEPEAAMLSEVDDTATTAV
eukprot:jgi/Botrbrau1/15088/Bobra.0255s0001.1